MSPLRPLAPSGGLRRIARARALPWTLAALSLAAAVTFALLWQRAERGEERRREVEETARRFLVALTNFEAATIERDVAEIRSFAVGEFADQLERFFGEETVRAIEEARARSVGRVRSVFVQSLAGSAASAFGVVAEEVTNRRQQQPRSETLRLDMELIETAEGWKVSRVEILQTPDGEAPAR